MRNIYIPILLLFVVTLGYSQKGNPDFNTNYKNEVSLELPQLINGVYQLSYERYIWNNFTATLGLAYKGKEGLVKISGLDGNKVKTDEIFYTGYQIVPEVRYYLRQTSKKMLTGFYLGAYFKYSMYKSQVEGTYNNSSNQLYDFEFDTSVSIASAGLMVGYKLPISKHFTIDFMIAGPGSGHYKFKFKNEKDLPNEFYDDFNEALENYSILDFINSDFRLSEVNRRSQFSAFSFRYGIALGYTF
ncbi:DUF3575 domain-containing protein [Formosa sp. 3Alg 14/1]|uniref:DUF3575 domain-containing protein n=1 Tax=Formosa sp. 3Alg 14/1 TaxID=3382190 RepID=UPI0039BE2E7E